MITFSRLGNHGQLGNQCFQYAMLLGVGAMQSYKIKIPKHFDKLKKFGLFELDHFQITAHRLRITDRRLVKSKYHEKGFQFDSGVFEQPDFTDYEGYFQSEKYFSHCPDLIRQEFTFVNSIAEWASEYTASKRVCSNIVAIHVRRGDYLNRKDLFQNLTMNYYDTAILNPAIPDARQYFVFSDDLEWCRANFLWDQVTFVETPSHWHDMAVMACCDAHIISASSFSWWGAWLCHRKDNPVIAPMPWFPKGPRDHYDMKDIVPERWITQEVK